MPKLTIDTKADESLFEPIEIEINGETFEAKRLTRPLLLGIESLMKQMGEGSFDAAYKAIELLLGDDALDVISDLDLAQVTKIIRFITDTSMPEEEKNESTPGDKASRS